MFNMARSEKMTLGVMKRLIVCIDGSEYDVNGRLDNSNTSNIHRLKSAIGKSSSSRRSHEVPLRSRPSPPWSVRILYRALC